MKLPGFTAEASIYGKSHYYRLGRQSVENYCVNRVIPLMAPTTCTGCECDHHGGCVCDSCTTTK